MFASAFCLSLLALCSPAQSAGAADAATLRAQVFARELRVRDAAADPRAASAWLDAALGRASERKSWTETADALDALARALDARPELDIEHWRAALLVLSGDTHPNLRAAAWRVLARSPQSIERAAKPAGGVMIWEERTERARAIARCGKDCAELEALCSDRDSHLAEIALAEWMQSPARDEQRVALSWFQAFENARASNDDRGVQLLELLEVAPRARGIAERVVLLAGTRAGDNEIEAHTRRALCLAASARQSRKLTGDELDLLATDWERASRNTPGARALLARTARELGPPLGERLLAQAVAHADEIEIASSCLEGAVEALEPARLLAVVAPNLRAQPALAELLLDDLRGRVEAWDADALAAWLAPSVAPSQRAHTLLVVAETFRLNKDSGSATLLVRALDDPDAAVAAQAFQALAAATDPTPWMESLHAAWARRSSEWQEARLADMSREIAWTPFRADLLGLAAKSRAASAQVAELLAPFRGDLQVASALSEWLEVEVARLRELPRGAPESEQKSQVITNVLSLVRALVLVEGDGAIQGLSDTLESSLGRSLELGKATIFQLGQSAAGRRALGSRLSPETPARLRAETAILLSAHEGREPAIRVLLDEYASFDEELRSRALRAFAEADDEASAARLSSVARYASSGAAEVITAVECLCSRARRSPRIVDELFGWLGLETLDSELRTLLIAELAKSGAPEVLARLAARLARIEAGGDYNLQAPREPEELALERETLISALAGADAVSGIDAAIAWRLPLEGAALDFSARAAGQHRADVDFTWRAELSLLAAFARADRLNLALDVAVGWRGLDARFLLECASRATEIATPKLAAAPNAAERLALAALIALGGEARVDDAAGLRFEARRLALELSSDRGDDLAFAARGAQLERDVRTGAIGSWTFARVCGDFDPRHGVDGLAELSAQVHLARARLASVARDDTGAQRELSLARDAAGASEAAQRAIDVLDQELRALRR